MSSVTQPTGSLSQALTRKKSNLLPVLVLGIGLIVAVGFAIMGYLESQKTEKVVILTTDVAYGQQITDANIGTLELPLHRPVQLAGITNPGLVVGQYAARNLGTNDMVQPTMLMAEPPLQPVYPNGEKLGDNMVPVPFSVSTLGPITYRDRVNIGFTDATGAPDLCDQAKQAATGEKPTSIVNVTGPAQLRPYACRMLSYMRVLYIDGDVAYLEMTPYQAQTIWALQAAGLQMWGERYGIASDPLPAFTRLDFGQVNTGDLLAPVPTTLPRTDPMVAPLIPGANAPIPGTVSQQP